MASKPWFDPKRDRWWIKYRPDPTGPWVRQSLGRHPEPWHPSRPPKKKVPASILDRARHYEDIEYRARYGLAAAPVRARPLGDYLDAYQAAYAAIHAPGSVRQLRRHLKRFREWAARQGITSVQAVNRAVCRDYLEWRIGQITHNALKAERGYLMPVWSRAVEDGLCEANPWQFARTPGKPEPHEPTFWTAAQVEAIARACRKPWQADYVRLLANTGLRATAGAMLQWDWIDWSRGLIRLPQLPGIKRPYTTLLGQGARDVLQKRYLPPAHPAYVFPAPRRDGPVPYDTAATAVTDAIRRAGVPPGTAHDLRHTYARTLMAAGVPVHVVQAQLGHSSLAITQRYATADEDTARQFIAGFALGADRA